MKYLGLIMLITVSTQTFGAQEAERQEAIRESYWMENQKNTDGAIRSLASLYNKTPKDFYINLRMAWLNYLKGNYKNALVHYDAALSVHNQAINAFMGKINVFMVQEKWKEAEEACKQALEVVPHDYGVTVKLANIYIAEKKYQEGVNLMDEMLAYYPESVELLNTKGYLLKMGGNTEGAERTYLQVLSMSPDNTIAKNHMAELSRTKKDPDSKDKPK